jgi:hypothetical protein
MRASDGAGWAAQRVAEEAQRIAREEALRAAHAAAAAQAAAAAARNARAASADLVERATGPSLFATPAAPAMAAPAPAPPPDVQAAVPATFRSKEPSVPPGTTPTFGPQATPQEAAAYVLQLEMTLEPANQANIFVQVLQDHQNDAAWLRSFYGSLGAESAARLVSDALSYESYRDWPPEAAQQHIQTVEASLDTLYQAGALNAGDMDVLMQQWATDSHQMSRGFNSGLALAFGELGYRSEGLQNLFVVSAVQLATSDTLAGDAANEVAAAAAWVLSRTSPDNEMTVLHEIQQQGRLPLFVDRAMQGPGVVSTILNSTQDAYDAATQTWNHPIETDYDGMARIIFNLSYAGLRDSFQGPSPLSATELSGLRTEVFAEAVKALGDERERLWSRNTFLKDGLARIFMEEYEPILGAVLAENMATFRQEDRAALLQGMQGLFQNALFTPPLGQESQRLVDFMSQKLAGMAGDIRGIDRGGLTDEQVAARYGPGMDRVRLTHLSGLLSGCLLSGLQQAEGAIRDNAVAAANALKMVLNVGLSLVPGASTLSGLGESVLGRILDEVSDEALDRLKDMTAEEAERYLVEQGNGRLDARAAVEELKHLAEGRVHLYGEWSEAFESGLGQN